MGESMQAFFSGRLGTTSGGGLSMEFCGSDEGNTIAIVGLRGKGVKKCSKAFCTLNGGLNNSNQVRSQALNF